MKVVYCSKTVASFSLDCKIAFISFINSYRSTTPYTHSISYIYSWFCLRIQLHQLSLLFFKRLSLLILVTQKSLEVSTLHVRFPSSPVTQSVEPIIPSSVGFQTISQLWSYKLLHLWESSATRGLLLPVHYSKFGRARSEDVLFVLSARESALRLDVRESRWLWDSPASSFRKIAAISGTTEIRIRTWSYLMMRYHIHLPLQYHSDLSLVCHTT